MKIAMISFTGNGRRLERSLAHELEKEGHQVLQAVKCKELESDKDAVKCSAGEWTGEQFRTRDVLIFIGAVQDCRALDRIFYRIKDNRSGGTGTG